MLKKKNSLLMLLILAALILIVVVVKVFDKRIEKIEASPGSTTGK